MNRNFLIAVLLLLGVEAQAQQQQEYYVFIQETAQQPFYVRMGDVSHSSSATGHIIVSRLRDSTYNFFIGFPRGRSTEQLFTIAMNKKDHGYELKNMNGRWQLFDLQTLELINPSNAQLNTGQTVMRSDSYSNLMAHVVDDSAVLYSRVEDTLTTDTVTINAEVKAEQAQQGADSLTVKGPEKIPADSVAVTKKSKKKAAKKTVDTTAVVKNDDEVAVNSPDTTVVVRSTDTAAVVNAPPPQVPFVPSSGRDKRDIIRVITENISEGKMMIYVDRSGPVNDTIRIVIPRRP
ncbi:MAG: hypothetical protein EOP49_28520 [Sphingobacteriales bacterium]|nr:MAG: hypothetical protein EOP49_28520 [Sphingobacteriales bacterium]